MGDYRAAGVPVWRSRSGEDVFTGSELTLRANQLLGIQGEFILNLNEHAQVRDLSAAFDIKAVKTTYSIGQANGKKFGEVIITNFKPDDYEPVRELF